MSNDVDETKMPLLDHLIELRRRLIYSVISFFICFIVSFHFADPIFNFLVEPLAELWKGQEQR
ncbi:MAG: twin-arginine translocase subunit TatC, partial [Alphaproteobacteria bacterium]